MYNLKKNGVIYTKRLQTVIFQIKNKSTSYKRDCDAIIFLIALKRLIDFSFVQIVSPKA